MKGCGMRKNTTYGERLSVYFYILAGRSEGIMTRFVSIANPCDMDEEWCFMKIPLDVSPAQMQPVQTEWQPYGRAYAVSILKWILACCTPEWIIEIESEWT
jgi:hypothetical protein